jgi:hypothetical protein
MAIFRPPLSRVMVFGIYVEHIDPGRRAGAHGDQRAGVVAPQCLHRLHVRAGVEEAVRRAGFLVVRAGKDGNAGAGELEGGFKRLRTTPLHWSASSFGETAARGLPDAIERRF